MAIINTTLFDYQISDLTRKQITRVSPTDADGKIRAVVDSFTVTCNTNDSIALFKLPKGAKLISLEVAAVSSDGFSVKAGIATIGSAGSITVVDSTKFSAGTDISVGGRYQFISTSAASDFVADKEYAVVLTTPDAFTSLPITFIGMYITGS